jgi:murein DD-endopeptidase MepM/ murein hydrolase activator NlpD
VTKGQTLGVTGSTGMAGGDHLHYGMILRDTFINPKEWWDPHWIKDNITSKVESVRSGIAK